MAEKSFKKKLLAPIIWACILTVVLACSITINATPPPPTATPLKIPVFPTAGILSTSTQYPTYTPYPTFTKSPPTETPNPTDTGNPTQTLEQTNNNNNNNNDVSFVEITRSTNSFACGGAPSSITISARVDNQPAVFYIDFFWRMEHKTTGEKTDYQDHNMSFEGGDLYKITIQATMVPNPKHWAEAWFSYQLVMVNNNKDYIRSQYYSDVDFKPCP